MWKERKNNLLECCWCVMVKCLAWRHWVFTAKHGSVVKMLPYFLFHYNWGFQCKILVTSAWKWSCFSYSGWQIVPFHSGASWLNTRQNISTHCSKRSMKLCSLCSFRKHTHNASGKCWEKNPYLNCVSEVSVWKNIPTMHRVDV